MLFVPKVLDLRKKMLASAATAAGSFIETYINPSSKIDRVVIRTHRFVGGKELTMVDPLSLRFLNLKNRLDFYENLVSFLYALF